MIRPAQDKQPDERGVRERGADIAADGAACRARCLLHAALEQSVYVTICAYAYFPAVKSLLPMQIAALLAVEDPQYNFLPKTIYILPRMDVTACMRIGNSISQLSTVPAVV